MRSNKGITLVELIIVICIIAILTGVVAPQLISWIEKANQVTDLNNARNIADALYFYSLDVDNEPLRYNTGLAAQGKGLRGYVYVDRDELRCSDEIVWKALVDAGMIPSTVTPATRWNTEQVWHNPKLRTRARLWDTYQIDFYFFEDGIIDHFTYSAAAAGSRTALTSDSELSQIFAHRLNSTTRSTELGESE